jgi:hypothetical protein
MKYYKLDKDVKQYLKRMAVDGIKTPADIYSVNDFVVGLKDLNLWMGCSIFCFRSNQNAGTGTSVYGFGNRMMYKETMVNGPTWSANGIVFNADGQHITKTFSIFNSPFTIIFCDKKEILSSSMRLRYLGDIGQKYGDTNFVNSRDFNLRHSQNSAIVSGSPSANTNFIIKGITLDNTFFGRSYVNGSFSLSNTSTTAGGWDPNPEGFSRFLQVTFASDTSIIVPLFCFWNTNLSALDHLNFYNLYKVTVGKGLGLP